MTKTKLSVEEKNTKDTRIKIIEAAIDLFSQDGYLGTSIRDITNAIGIKESSLYHHFVSKKEILDNIYDLFKKLIDKETLVNMVLPETIKPLESYLMLQNNLINLKKFFDRQEIKKIYRIISMERYRDKQAFEIMTYDIYQKMHKYYEALFSKMIASAIIKPLLNPTILAHEYVYTVFGMFEDYNIQKYYNKNTTTIEDLMYEYIKFFWDRVKNI